MQYYIRESNESTLRNYFNTNLIVNLWWNTPVTLFEINNTIGLSEKQVRKLSISKKPYRLKYNDSRHSAYQHTKFNIVTVGNVYEQDYNPILTSKNKFVDKRNFAVMTNDVHQKHDKDDIQKPSIKKPKNKKIKTNDKRQMTNDTIILSTTNDKYEKLRDNFFLPISFRTRRFVRTQIPCMNDMKKNVLIKLSEIYLNNRIQNGNLVLQY